jgi:hypothetical protein
VAFARSFFDTCCDVACHTDVNRFLTYGKVKGPRGWKSIPNCKNKKYIAASASHYVLMLLL